jgi:hypothetical protein
MAASRPTFDIHAFPAETRSRRCEILASAQLVNARFPSTSIQSTEQVARWHAAGVANGGGSAEAPPGVREAALGSLYLAYLRDPDGNKLGALYRVPA